MTEEADGTPLHRPAFVFGYYSGPNDRLSNIYDKHRVQFYSEIIKPPNKRSGNRAADPNRLRRLFYAQTLYGQFVLLGFFMNPDAGDPDREFLRKHLQIDALDSVLFIMNKPPWSAARSQTGDKRFWGAKGEVQLFLDRLYSSAMLPMRRSRRVTQEATTTNVESLYLFLPEERSLAHVYQSYSNQYKFFTALESTHLSKVLGEVRTRVRMTRGGGGGEVTYRDLSEGEQQLLLVLGLLKFTARDEALFLLDEPDTHLNPVWSTQYLDFLNQFIRMRDRKQNCHIVMSSHDPLVFAGLTRQEVVILRRDEDGAAVAERPIEDPKGMNFSTILTSDLFRLRSTVAPKIQKKIDRQRELTYTTDRTQKQNKELQSLNAELQDLGFTRSSRDPLYEQFVKAWTLRQNQDWVESVKLSPEQRCEQERLALQILDDLMQRKAKA
jgi:ABC-type uncharacterized transport system ATPase subunit